MPSIPTLRVFHQPSHTPATFLTTVVCLHSYLSLLEDSTTSFQYCQGPRAGSRGVFGLVEFVVVAVVFVLFWPCCVLNVTYIPTVYLHAHVFEPLPSLPQLVAILWKVVGPGGGGASLEEVSHRILS